MTAVLSLIAALAAAPVAADPRSTIAYFYDAQELPPLSVDDLAAHRKQVAGDPEAVAADAALNAWKLCLQDALLHWAPLRQGAGTLVDGAFGRCADLSRQYRFHLMRVTEGGRVVVDLQMARGMSRTLEDIWRPRLIAAALDQELARQAAEAPKPAAAARPTLP